MVHLVCLSKGHHGKASSNRCFALTFEFMISGFPSEQRGTTESTTKQQAFPLVTCSTFKGKKCVCWSRTQSTFRRRTHKGTKKREWKKLLAFKT